MPTAADRSNWDQSFMEEESQRNSTGSPRSSVSGDESPVPSPLWSSETSFGTSDDLLKTSRNVMQANSTQLINDNTEQHVYQNSPCNYDVPRSRPICESVVEGPSTRVTLEPAEDKGDNGNGCSSAITRRTAVNLPQICIVHPMRQDASMRSETVAADRSPTSPRAHHHPGVAANTAMVVSSEVDYERIARTRSRLDESGFFFGAISPAQARQRLASYPAGTFLVRSSSDPRYLFSLSVRTQSPGVSTSVRIVYESGRFRWDSNPDRVERMPTFECVLELLDHHVREGRGASGSLRTETFVFMERSGRRETPVVLRRPLPQDGSPSSLKHLCRRRIGGLVDGRSVDRLQLIPTLKQYLSDYPFDL